MTATRSDIGEAGRRNDLFIMEIKEARERWPEIDLDTLRVILPSQAEYGVPLRIVGAEFETVMPEQTGQHILSYAPKATTLVIWK